MSIRYARGWEPPDEAGSQLAAFQALDPEKVMTRLFAHVHHLVGVDAGVVFGFDPNGRMVVEWTREVEGAALASLSQPDQGGLSLVAQSASDRATKVWPPLDWRTPEPPDQGLDRLGWRRAIAVPLLDAGEVTGVFLAGWQTPAKLDRDAVAVIEATAAHASSALQSARLFQELKREKERLRRVLEAFPVPAVVVAHQTQTIKWVNQQAETLLGDLRGMAYNEAIAARQVVTLDQAPPTVDGSADNPPEPSASALIQVRAVDGTNRILAPHSAPISAEELVVTLSDVTSEVRLDHTRSRFLHMVSHHLRTPLTPLLGYLDLLEERLTPSDDPLVAEALQVMGSTFTHMTTQVERLERAAELGIRDPGKRSLIGARALIHDTWTKADGASDELLVGGDTDAEIICDTDALSAALAEIFENARTHGKAPVVVTIRSRPTGVEILITDQGPSIPPAWAEAIFMPYISAADGYTAVSTGGTGLGLALARLYVEAAGGTLTYQTADHSFILTI